MEFNRYNIIAAIEIMLKGHYTFNEKNDELNKLKRQIDVLQQQMQDFELHLSGVLPLDHALKRGISDVAGTFGPTEERVEFYFAVPANKKLPDPLIIFHVTKNTHSVYRYNELVSSNILVFHNGKFIPVSECSLLVPLVQDDITG